MTGFFGLAVCLRRRYGLRVRCVSYGVKLVTMTDKELENKLAKLGYTRLWLDYGVLTIEYFLVQEQEFNHSDDKFTEHYRYRAFTDYLSSKSQLSDTEFENYLKLTLADEDPLMAGAAATDLFRKRIDLTEHQFHKLCKTLGHFGEWTNKVVIRQTLLRKLKQNKMTTDLFRECIENGDSVVHGCILEIADKNQLQELVLKGSNKRIKKIAAKKLKELSNKTRRG